MDEIGRSHIIRNFIGKDILKVFYEYSLIMAKRNRPKAADGQRVTVYESTVGHCIDLRYGDALADSLLIFCCEKISKTVGFDLVPITSYYRIYGPECKLPVHIDQPEYEWSATICMGYSAKEPWPIFLKQEPFYLEAGDALIYQGAKEEHSRPVFKGSWQSQLFLHYKEVEDEEIRK
jgi:hypothetical protein